MKAAGDNTYSLSEKSGIPAPTLNRLLNGKHKNPSVDNLLKIAKAYGINTSQLLGELPLQIKTKIGIEKDPIPSITIDEYRKIAAESANINSGSDQVKEAIIKLIERIPDNSLPNEMIGLIESALQTEQKNILKTETVFTFINHPEQEYKVISKNRSKRK